MPGGWRIFRQREDKVEPNYITVAINTWRSIQQPVTKEEIIAVCENVDYPPNEDASLGKRSRSSDSDNGDERINKR